MDCESNVIWPCGASGAHAIPEPLIMYRVNCATR